MSYRWRPSKSQRKAFAIRMQDPEEQAAYTARKEERAEKRRATSVFDYDKAGGMYVATKEQHDFAMWKRPANLTPEQEDAFNQVASSYICQEKIHHDLIHMVNELRRANG